MMVGDIEAHKCPNCGAEGKENWRIYRGGGSPVAQFPPKEAEIHAVLLRESPSMLVVILNWVLLLGTLACMCILAWDVLVRGKRVSK
jgi:hypothetical protein